MTEKQERAAALGVAKSVATDLRVMLEDAKQNVEAFEDYVDSWDMDVARHQQDTEALDPRSFTERYVISRALEQIEDLTHIHRGSTAHTHYRAARDRLIQLAGGGKR